MPNFIDDSLISKGNKMESIAALNAHNMTNKISFSAQDMPNMADIEN